MMYHPIRKPYLLLGIQLGVITIPHPRTGPFWPRLRRERYLVVTLSPDGSCGEVEVPRLCSVVTCERKHQNPNPRSPFSFYQIER